MPSTKYILSFDKVPMVFTVTYTGGQCKKIEHKKGVYTSTQWTKLNNAIPYYERHIEEMISHYKGRVSFEKVEKGTATQYATFLDNYRDWFYGKFGFHPPMNGVEGKALKSIIKYFNENTANEAEALASWQAVLLNWEVLDLFYKKQTQLRQINSNISNILIQIQDDAGNTMGDANSRKV